MLLHCRVEVHQTPLSALLFPIGQTWVLTTSVSDMGTTFGMTHHKELLDTPAVLPLEKMKPIEQYSSLDK
jgi:hypothetical protein